MKDLDLQSRAIELVERLKSDGLCSADIAAFLVFGLSHIALEKGAPAEIKKLLAELAK